jgi:hypothetical protein
MRGSASPDLFLELAETSRWRDEYVKGEIEEVKRSAKKIMRTD